jgi:hypothetical protein
VCVVPAATTKRRLVFAIAITSYAVVFTSFVLFEVPGLGLGHFFYIPVALVAVSLGARGGFLGGAIAAALYALAIIVARTCRRGTSSRMGPASASSRSHRAARS